MYYVGKTSYIVVWLFMSRMLKVQLYVLYFLLCTVTPRSTGVVGGKEITPVNRGFVNELYMAMGKGGYPGKSGFPVNRGTVNCGLTVHL